jgi:hypothetical protein
MTNQDTAIRMVAHIIVDKDESFGQPVVPNGIPLSKIHHAAFDAHLIGIDPDYGVNVSDQLLDLHDGPLLETSLLEIQRLIGYGLAIPMEQRLAEMMIDEHAFRLTLMGRRLGALLRMRVEQFT